MEKKELETLHNLLKQLENELEEKYIKDNNLTDDDRYDESVMDYFYSTEYDPSCIAVISLAENTVEDLINDGFPDFSEEEVDDQPHIDFEEDEGEEK